MLDLIIGRLFAGLIGILLILWMVDLGITWWRKSGNAPCGRVEWFGKKILYILTILAVLTVPPVMGVGFLNTVFGVTEWWTFFLAAGLGGALLWLIGTHPLLERWIHFLRRES